MKLITKSEFKPFTTYKNFDCWVEKIDYETARVLVKITSQTKQLHLDMYLSEFEDLIKSFENYEGESE